MTSRRHAAGWLCRCCCRTSRQHCWRVPLPLLLPWPLLLAVCRVGADPCVRPAVAVDVTPLPLGEVAAQPPVRAVSPEDHGDPFGVAMPPDVPKARPSPGPSGHPLPEGEGFAPSPLLPLPQGHSMRCPAVAVTSRVHCTRVPLPLKCGDLVPRRACPAVFLRRRNHGDLGGLAMPTLSCGAAMLPASRGVMPSAVCGAEMQGVKRDGVQSRGVALHPRDHFPG